LDKGFRFLRYRSSYPIAPEPEVAHQSAESAKEERQTQGNKKNSERQN
jgi:hypothetical protein